MAFNWNLIALSGPSVAADASLESCKECGCREFYRQPDFRRDIGLWIIALASVATVLLMVEGYNWFVIWSPMLGVVILDRFFLRLAPDVVICYRCGLIHRGLDRKAADRFEAFDLEVHDRHQYAESHKS